MTRAEDLRLIEEILDEIITDLREGGQGSGHFEHEGIPGHQGGSAPDEGGGQPDWQTQWHKDWEAKLKKWSEEAPKPTPKPERRVYKPSGSKVDLKKVNWDEGDSLDDDDKGAFEDIINPMLDEIKADPDFPEGYCAAVSTTLWDRLGRPKALRPYSVFVGEDEHVILYNKKMGWAVDPTGKQFGLGMFPNDPTEVYKNFHRLTDDEISWGLQEYQDLIDKAKEVGTSASGNRGHAGRPGKVGGSAPQYGSLSISKGPVEDVERYVVDTYGNWMYEPEHEFDYHTRIYAKYVMANRDKFDDVYMPNGESVVTRADWILGSQLIEDWQFEDEIQSQTGLVSLELLSIDPGGKQDLMIKVGHRTSIDFLNAAWKMVKRHIQRGDIRVSQFSRIVVARKELHRIDPEEIERLIGFDPHEQPVHGEVAEFEPGESLEDIKTEYEDTLTDVMSRYVFSDRGLGSFKNEFKRAVNDAFTLSFYAGWADSGNGDPVPDKDVTWLIGKIDAETGFADSLFQDLKTMKKELEPDEITDWIADRAVGYTNTLNGIYDEGKLRGLGNKMLTFGGIDGQESCATCKRLKGKRHRASWWVRHGLIPGQSGNENFICRGYNCKHQLTDDKGEIVTAEDLGLVQRENWLEELVEGGRGSGNYGHKGRPGLEGGSQTEDWGSVDDTDDLEFMELPGGMGATYGYFVLPNDQLIDLYAGGHSWDEHVDFVRNHPEAFGLDPSKVGMDSDSERYQAYIDALSNGTIRVRFWPGGGGEGEDNSILSLETSSVDDRMLRRLQHLAANDKLFQSVDVVWEGYNGLIQCTWEEFLLATHVTGIGTTMSLREIGTKASGHHGHKGIPGHRGGSAPEGAALSIPVSDPKDTQDAYDTALFILKHETGDPVPEHIQRYIDGNWMKDSSEFEDNGAWARQMLASKNIKDLVANSQGILGEEDLKILWELRQDDPKWFLFNSPIKISLMDSSALSDPLSDQEWFPTGTIIPDGLTAMIMGKWDMGPDGITISIARDSDKYGVSRRGTFYHEIGHLLPAYLVRQYAGPQNPFETDGDYVDRFAKVLAGEVASEGGKGSGNFKHAGRLGHVGGSAPQDFGWGYAVGTGKTLAKGDGSELYRWANLTEIVRSSVGKRLTSLDVSDKPDFYFAPVKVMPETASVTDTIYGRYILDKDALIKGGWSKDPHLKAEGAWRHLPGNLGKDWSEISDADVAKFYLDAIRGFEIVQFPTGKDFTISQVRDILAYRIGRRIPVVFTSVPNITNPFETASEGGQGSGNFGHAGRPGLEGGSQASKEAILTDYLEKVKSIASRSKESIVLEHGKFYKPQPLPKGYKKGKSKQCYQNAYQLSQREDLTYVEGFAMPDFVDLPIEHAWVVDSEGNVIDNTWDTPGSAYFGMTFDEHFIDQVLSDTGEYGVITLHSQVFRDKYFGDLKVEEGGPGSGNFGHKGRPGLVGGSLSSGDTMSRYMNADGTWTKEREALHQEIIAKFFEGKTPVDNPESFVLGGGPASGKSTLVNSGLIAIPENTVLASGDDIKPLLPEYEKMGAVYVHEESSYLSKEIAREAAAKKFNVMMDGTGDGGLRALIAKVESMRPFGGKVHGIYVTVDIETAIKRSIERAKKTGRYMPESVLRETHKAVSALFPEIVRSGMFDSLRLFDTSGSRARLIMSALGNQATIYDDVLYREFLDKGK